VVLPGGTGNEPDGIIPVCCALTSAEEPDAAELFALFNEHRAANGVPEVTYDVDLEATVQGHLLHQALHPFTGWTAPEASVATSDDRGAVCGTSTSGGVSGTNHPTAAVAMTAWKADTSINANMLDTHHHRAGAGRYANRWALQFGP
jgi:uncharacterized protein YkwD